FFKEFVVNYTNAPMIVGDALKDTEDADGVFSGLMQYLPGIKEWPLDGFVGQYDTRTWHYAEAPAGPRATPPPAGPPFDPLVRSLLTPPPRRDQPLQHPLGNVGRPGAGVMALRGHASIQGSTDIPTLYHSIHGYMNHPSALKGHDSLRDWLLAETTPRGYWANTPKFMVSYLKSMYGATATKGNDFGYDWHPKIIGDHSH